MSNRITINARGVITIPLKVREAFGLQANDELIIEQSSQGILLRPSVAVPIEIYTDDRISEFGSDEQALDSLLPNDG